METERTPRVKGVALMRAKEHIDAKLGHGWYAKYAKIVGAEEVPLASSWYDLEPLILVEEKAASMIGVSFDRLSQDCARRNATYDLPFIYKAFFKLASPTALLSLIPKIWRTYGDFGNPSVISNERGFCIAKNENIPPDIIPWITSAWVGWLDAAVEMAGGKNVSSRISRVWWIDPGDDMDKNQLKAFEIEVSYDY